MENQIDQDRQQLAKEYARIRRRLMLLDLGLGVGLLLAFLLTGWSAALQTWITSWTSNPWLIVLVYSGILGGVFYLVDLPLSYYGGYILPHRYQQSNQDVKGWLQDQAKGLAIGAFFGLSLIQIIYLLLRATPDYWWLWAAGFLLLFNVVLANLAPILLFPIFYRFKPLAEDYQDLQDRLLELAQRAGVRVMGVFAFDMSRRTKSANAALTGLGGTRRIILGDTLLEEFSQDEIETVLAHELAHHVHNDIPVGMAVQSGLTLGGLYLTSLGLSRVVDFFGFQSIADVGALPIFAILLGAYNLLTMPISNYYSRTRETKADQYALELTGKGQAYASALVRLGNQNLAEIDPEPWVETLLYSHPALAKRISRAEDFQSNSSEPVSP